MKRICVYCGSSPGQSPKYLKLATATGTLLAARGLGLVYGGGNLGLMGALADAVLAGGGEVLGVIPGFMVEKEQAHQGLTELRVVHTMSERKVVMAEAADAFLVLPGGVGTLEELIETLSWAQLGLHKKPIGVVNTDGYYEFLRSLMDRMMSEGFVPESTRELIRFGDTPDAVLQQIL